MSDDLLGTVLNQRYRLDAVLGAGGMGVVYRAAQIDSRGDRVRDVAVKMIRPALLTTGTDAIARFLREIRAAALLRGPHAIPVYDFGETESGRLYYVMELVEGPTLQEVFAGPISLPVDRLMEIGAQICSALDEAHHLNPPVVHRDLKPRNVFVEGWPASVRARVGDFGLAKTADNETDVISAADSSAGTPRYMSPEQCLGRPVDARSDLYALGVILYEGLAGKPPFAGERMAVMHQHVYEPPPPLPGFVPANVRRVIEALLAKSPDDRPANAMMLRRELTRSADAPPPTSRSFVALVVAIATVVVLALGTWLLFGAQFPSHPRDIARTAPKHASGEGQPHPPAQDAARTGIAVFEFRNEREDDREHDWIRGALQSTFSTELGRVRHLRVLSREIVEESAPKDTRPLEVTRLLGAEKFITGSFAVLGKQIQIAVRLVDVKSGEQEKAESIEGNVDEFFGLQKQLTLAMVNQLPVAVSASERDAIAQQNPSQNQARAVDAYRLMLQGEGLDEGAEDDDTEGDDRGAQRESDWFWAAIVRLLEPTPATAQEQTSAEQEIRQVLEGYRQALERGDVDGIEETWGKLTARRRQGLEEYFAIADALKITFDRVEIHPVEDNKYVVSYVRRDQFSDKRTGEQVNLEVQLVNTAERVGAQWRIKNAKRLAGED